MSLRLTLVSPAGDPDEVERVATGWRLVAAAAAGAADVLRAEPTSFADTWQGLAATAATDSLTGMAALADSVAQAIGDGALALDSWAAALRRAQEAVAAQQVIANDAYEQYALATSWQAVDTGTDPAGELAQVHSQVSWAVGQATDLDADATRTRQALARIPRGRSRACVGLRLATPLRPNLPCGNPR